MNIKTFFKKIYPEPNTGCWIWSGNQDKHGYGILNKKVNGFRTAHRYSYFLANGEYDQNLWVLHHCDNPFCVNPDHLYLGNVIDNTRDRTTRGRHCDMRGEHHPTSKYTVGLIKEVRDFYSKNRITYRELGLKFGIPEGTVYGIIKKTRWPHI